MSAASTAAILVVESDRLLGQEIAAQLVADGFRVELARNAEHARILARASAPTLAVLGSLDAPRGALALLEEIRRSPEAGGAWDRALPAIVVGCVSRELDILRAFEAGADDFLAEPASYQELRARLRAILRRSTGVARSARLIQVGSLAIDTHAHSVCVDSREVTLRRMEYELLVHLAREPGRVFAKDELLRSVWEFRSGGSTRTVDSHASRLRRKLAPEGTRRWIVNVWGIGYRLI